MSQLHKILKSIRKKSNKGKIGRGAIFVVVILTTLIFTGYLFVGGTLPTKLPKINRNLDTVQLVPITPGVAQNSLQLYTFTGATVTPRPTLLPNAPPPTNGVPMASAQCPTLKGKENPEMVWSLGIATTKASGNQQALIVHYTAAHPILLGSGAVTQMQKFPADHAANPNVGNVNIKDQDSFPFSPAVFITDITGNPNDTSGDAQSGGVPQNPSDIYGAWKAAGAVNPSAPNYPQLSGGDDQPWPPANGPGGGSRDTTWGAEVIWKTATLKTKTGQALQAGKTYRMQIVLHDGQGTGNVAQICTNVTIPTGSGTAPGNGAAPVPIVGQP